MSTTHDAPSSTTDADAVVPALEARGLYKRYGSVTAINGADFSLRPGEVLAVIGDNGAGKSTLIKTLAGAVVPDAGEILMNGAPVHFRSTRDARRHGIDIPRQIAVAGYGDLDFSAEVFPSLTTVRISDYEVGKLAGEMMLRRLGGDSSVQRIIQVPVELKVRESTART